jgi:phage terminase large subunit
MIELGYAPRAPQLALHHAMEGHRWVVAVCHRRMGKTVAAVNHLIMKALECQKERPRFAYIAPTLKQAKLVAWDYLKHYTDPVPEREQRESELMVNLPGGRRVTLFGADNPDAIRGAYFDGVVLDEYGLQPPNLFPEVVRPLLSDRQGWATFLGTPNGRNEFYRVWQRAQQDETGQWAGVMFKASQTGIITAEELVDARAAMTEEQYLQEYECSFEAAVRGSIYGSELDLARQEGRITLVPVDPILPVHTTWDLGMGDATSIWFSQHTKTGEVRLVDYYEASGEGLPHYVSVLQQKGYAYGEHYAPHDIQVRELSSGRSRWEVAQGLGITFKIVPRIARRTGNELEEGIHAARMLLPKCWFDTKKVATGLDALQHYRRDFNARLGEFKATPIHDWSSHAADAFRYLAIWASAPKQEREPVYTRPLPKGFTTSAWMGG